MTFITGLAGHGAVEAARGYGRYWEPARRVGARPTGLYSADYKGDGLTKPATRLLEGGPSSPFG